MASQGVKRDLELMNLEIQDMYNRLDMWADLNNVDFAEYYPTQYEAVKSVPNSVITKNKYGETIGMDIEIQAPKEFNPPAVIDSNVPNNMYSGGGGNYGGSGYRMNGSGGGTSPNVFSSGAKSVNTGTKVLTTAGNIGSALMGASLGAKLGKRITTAMYDAGYEWGWSEADWENWTSGLDPVDQTVFRTLFGIDSNGNTVAYAPEDMLALEYMELLKKGAFDTIFTPGEDKYTGEETITSLTSGGAVATAVIGAIRSVYPNLSIASACTQAITDFINTNGDGVYIGQGWTNGGAYSGWSPLRIYYIPKTVGDAITLGRSVTAKSIELRGTATASGTMTIDAYRTSPTVALSPETVIQGTKVTSNTTIISNINSTASSGVPGMEDDSRATTQIDPNVITGTTPETILPQLKQNYPQLFDGSIYEDVPQEDGSTKHITYIPIPWPTKDVDGNPITGIPSQTDPQVAPDTSTDDEIKDLIDTLTDFFNNPPTTGTGGSPSVIVPVGSASSLWKIYNPTQAQIDAFGSWLWSSNFVEQIKKLFNDPMQAIIGVHKVFATPSIGGTATIKVGYLDSGVPSDYIDDQYTTIDCGTVNLREYFGNVFDYAPYTRVSLYLPFIGIVDLDVADVMRASISIVYHVDVLTGACLADVKVIRDACGGVLYQYSGSAIVTYPVSSGNYMGMVAGVLSVASGIAGTVLSGGALAPALIGGVVGASHLHTDVSHSGGFSGCAGAMGGKIPYIIVSRPQPALAGNYEHFTGLPANAHVTLANCSGMTRVKSVYVKSIHRATDEEKDMIENQLKAGVLV